MLHVWCHGDNKTKWEAGMVVQTLKCHGGMGGGSPGDQGYSALFSFRIAPATEQDSVSDNFKNKTKQPRSDHWYPKILQMHQTLCCKRLF